MNKLIAFIMVLMLVAACDTSSSTSSESTIVWSDEEEYEPEYIEQEILVNCPSCGGYGTIMTMYGPMLCPDCTGKGEPSQHIETVTVRNPSFKGGSKIKNSCNIGSHDCDFGVDRNHDGWCDNCMKNGYKCHMSDHSPIYR